MQKKEEGDGMKNKRGMRKERRGKCRENEEGDAERKKREIQGKEERRRKLQTDAERELYCIFRFFDGLVLYMLRKSCLAIVKLINSCDSLPWKL